MRRPDWKWSNCQIVELDFLSGDHVRQAVLGKLEEMNLQEEIRESLVEEITKLSCGHPGIMSKILYNPPGGAWVTCMDGVKLPNNIRQQIFADHVKPVVSDILKQVKDAKLRQAFKILCVFRKYHIYTVRSLQMIANGQGSQIPMGKFSNVQELLSPFSSSDARTFPGKLQEAGLASKDDMQDYFQNGVVRQLVLGQMQQEQKIIFKQLNKLALEINDSYLADRSVDGNKVNYKLADAAQRSRMVESFYHFLNCLDDESENNKDSIIHKIGIYHGRLRGEIADDISLRRDLQSQIIKDQDIWDRLCHLLGEKNRSKHNIQIFLSGRYNLSVV